MEWEKKRPGGITMYVIKAIAGRLVAGLNVQLPLRGTRGFATGEPRDSRHRPYPIQKRGFAPKVGKYYASVNMQGNSKTFYGKTLVSAQKKAVCHYRAVLKQAIEEASFVQATIPKPRWSPFVGA